MRTDVIRNIHPDLPETWAGKLFLTFDLDWAHDDVIRHTIDIVEHADAHATWFVTHPTPVLDRLRSNPKFELGIHPNFNFLLNGDARNGANAEEVVDRMLAIVPDARSVRSHSMTQSSVLLQLFRDKGLTHDCNHFVPHQTGIELTPWRIWNGLIRCPYSWEDDIACMDGDIGNRIQLGRSLNVVDFHPIHVFLNTEHLDRYENSRAVHGNPEGLRKLRNGGIGAHSALNNLIDSLLK